MSRNLVALSQLAQLQREASFKHVHEHCGQPWNGLADRAAAWAMYNTTDEWKWTKVCASELQLGWAATIAHMDKQEGAYPQNVKGLYNTRGHFGGAMDPPTTTQPAASQTRKFDIVMITTNVLNLVEADKKEKATQREVGNSGAGRRATLQKSLHEEAATLQEYKRPDQQKAHTKENTTLQSLAADRIYEQIPEDVNYGLQSDGRTTTTNFGM